jgi:hypothetical protein
MVSPSVLGKSRNVAPRGGGYGISCAMYSPFLAQFVHTVGEAAYCKPFRRLGNVSQSQIGLSLPNHQVNDD